MKGSKVLGQAGFVDTTLPNLRGDVLVDSVTTAWFVESVDTTLPNLVGGVLVDGVVSVAEGDKIWHRQA